ncbi:PDE4D isoform 5 [Pan troglodytes]|uniref:Phosphodiesterase 4D n=3 Tax=Homininae TaxID=207598 RepID=D6RBB2_HUMAN|nr:PDE4D isoform 5 [Pan troglodytes]
MKRNTCDLLSRSKSPAYCDLIFLLWPLKL